MAAMGDRYPRHVLAKILKRSLSTSSTALRVAFKASASAMNLSASTSEPGVGASPYFSVYASNAPNATCNCGERSILAKSLNKKSPGDASASAYG